MCLDRFLDDLEIEFEEIFWRDDPDRILAERIGKLQIAAKSAEAAIARHNATIEKLECRIAPLRQLESNLSEHVEIYIYVGDRANAWRRALELDRVRGELAALGRQISLEQQRRQTDADKLEEIQADISSLRGSLAARI